jgi:hypothetical protein
MFSAGRANTPFRVLIVFHAANRAAQTDIMCAH